MRLGFLLTLLPLLCAEAEPIVDFEGVRSLARALAKQPMGQPLPAMPPFWSGLSPADVASLAPTPAAWLWPTDESLFSAAPLFPNPALFEGQTQIWNIDKTAKTVTELSWRPERFDFSHVKVPSDTTPPTGYGGVRIFTPLVKAPEKNALWEWSQFQGEAGLAPGLEWGTRARPLAILRGVDTPPQYPNFRQLWLVAPTEAERIFHIYGLIDCPELTAAVKYRIFPGRDTAAEVECDVTLRKNDFRLGYAAATCYFSHSENQLSRPADPRPEAHEADGLLLQYTEQDAQWHSLGAGNTAYHGTFPVDKMWGYGLIQRDREISHYEDLETAWERKCSWFAEPVGNWPSGKIHCYELPTNGSLSPNIHVCWQPALGATVGTPVTTQWRNHWTHEVPMPRISKVASVRAAQTAVFSGDTQGQQVRYVVDFSAISASATPTPDLVVPFVEIDERSVLISKKIHLVPNTGGWRVEIQVNYPESTNFSEIRCSLLLKGRPISEKWHYVWKK